MSGPFGSSPWGYNPGGDFYPYTIDQSLRFNDNDSAYLSRTPSSAGSLTTWTWSGWVKRGNLAAGMPARGTIFGSSLTLFGFFNATSGVAADTFGVYITDGEDDRFITNRVFRDTSAWYHFVVVLDTTNSTADDRFRLYVNGVRETSFSRADAITQNRTAGVNAEVAHAIGRQSPAASQYFDGYLAEMNFIDGTALTADSFGETKDGVWIPKAYSGSYGTNGFYLPFDDSSAIGDDESGNTNDWTANNLAASDVVLDSPTNNFATYNPLDRSGNLFSEGNLKIGDITSSAALATAGTMAMRSGKWYFEILRTSGVNGGYWGIIREDQNILDGNHGLSSGDYAYYVQNNGSLKLNAASTSSWITAYSTGDIIQVAYDADTGKVWFGRNNTWGNSGDPANGTNEAGTVDSFATYGYKVWTRVIGNASQYEYATLNCGQDSTFAGATTAGGNQDDNGIGDFKYAPPAGFLSLCSASLPTPTIVDGSEYFNTLLWTGDGSNPRTLSGLDFAADFIWHKSRSSASMDHHAIQDVVRGFNTNNNLYTSLTGSETAYPNRGVINSVSSTGFTFNQNASDYSTADGLNQNNSTFVGWNWKAGGTAVSNTDGSITSSVSANTDAGFSIVSYTGTGSNATVGHGLSTTAPSFIILKGRNEARQWIIGSDALTDWTKYLLFTTGNEGTASDVWNSTAPTSSVFSVGTNINSNKSTVDYIAYCFHSVEGYSKVGSYTGNGSTSSGSFVYTGFRPAWVLIKCRTSNSTNWLLLDNKREGYNSAQDVLFPESNADEETNAAKTVDFLSNGFIVAATTNASTNASGSTYIYLAFAESPFKFANAR